MAQRRRRNPASRVEREALAALLSETVAMWLQSLTPEQKGFVGVLSRLGPASDETLAQELGLNIEDVLVLRASIIESAREAGLG